MTCANLCPTVDPFLGQASDNGFGDLIKHKNATIIFDNLKYIETFDESFIKNHNTFTNFTELESVIVQNE